MAAEKPPATILITSTSLIDSILIGIEIFY